MVIVSRCLVCAATAAALCASCASDGDAPDRPGPSHSSSMTVNSLQQGSHGSWSTPETFCSIAFSHIPGGIGLYSVARIEVVAENSADAPEWDTGLAAWVTLSSLEAGGATLEVRLPALHELREGEYLADFALTVGEELLILHTGPLESNAGQSRLVETGVLRVRAGRVENQQLGFYFDATVEDLVSAYDSVRTEMGHLFPGDRSRPLQVDFGRDCPSDALIPAVAFEFHDHEGDESSFRPGDPDAGGAATGEPDAG